MPMQPDRRGEDERGPGHELGHDARAARVVVGAGEVQARVRAAERGRRVGNGQVAVVRDPVGDLEVGGGIAEIDDLLGTFGQLPDGEGYGDGDRGGQRPPVCCGWLGCGLGCGGLGFLGFLGSGLGGLGSGCGGLGFAAGFAGLAEGGPGGGELADGEVAQPGGQRGEHEHHRPSRETPGQQQREGRQQPGRGQQRRHHGDGAEQPPGPARVLLRRRRRCYGIVCLSDLSDPCGAWPMTHEPTIGPVPEEPRPPRVARRVPEGPSPRGASRSLTRFGGGAFGLDAAGLGGQEPENHRGGVDEVAEASRGGQHEHGGKAEDQADGRGGDVARRADDQGHRDGQAGADEQDRPRWCGRARRSGPGRGRAAGCPPGT